MKIVYKIINSLSIGLKISLGYFLIILVFGFQVFVNLDSMDKISKDFKDLTNITENTITILNIDKNISDLQKSVLTYSQTGSKSVIETMKRTFSDIESRLEIVKQGTHSKQSKEQIFKMTKVINNYGDSLQSLQDRYNYRNELVTKKLPSIMNEITSYIQNISANTKSNADYSNSQRILSIWLEARISAMLFLKDRKHSEKLKVKTLLSKIEGIYNDNKLSKTSDQDAKKLNLIALLKQFADIFEQSIQANRIYLSLVNVVMAGEVLEFAELARILREDELQYLKNIALDNQRFLKQIERFLILSVILSIPVIISIAFFFHFNISKDIKAIAATFTRLQEGDDEVLPVVNRTDEIGRLSKAANDYAMVSQNLKKAKNVAEKLANTKSEFLANMSHEIRTPMNGILGMVSLLYETETNDEQKHMLDTISSCGEDLMTILNDILDISKIESGKIVLEKIPFNFKKMIQDILFLFEGEAKKKGIEFKTTPWNPNFPDYLTGDITRIKQILINLISNAIKFTSKGSVTLHIKARKINLEEYRINFSVEDTGIGISPDDQKKLFKAFSQADSSITRRYGGTGLGLTISSRLAQIMGSQIKVQSTPGIGSNFSFEIKMATASKPKRTTIDIKTGVQKSILHILLVEDNPINTELATIIIKKLGHQIETAKNGQEAVSKVKNMEFDVVFMDMQMPIMDGIQATKEIRKLEDKSDIPIIAMTANAMQEDQDKCFAAGMNEFLTKPIRKNDLSDMLDKVMDHQISQDTDKKHKNII